MQNSSSTEAADVVSDTVCVDTSYGDTFRNLLALAKEGDYTHLCTVDMDDMGYLDALKSEKEHIQQYDTSVIVAVRYRGGNFMYRVVKFFWRYIHNMWIRIYTGTVIEDAASTIRLYPLAVLENLTLTSKGYEVYQEILLKTVWSGHTLYSISVPYHEKKIRKTYKGLAHATGLLMLWLKAFFHRFLSPFSGAPVPGDSFLEKLKNLITHELKVNTSAGKAAFSLALGVYFGLLPIHGFQIISLLFVTTKCRLNRPLAFLGVNVSIAPLLPIVFYAALKVGSLVTGSSVELSLDDADLLSKTVTYGVDFILGSLVLAHVMGLLVFLSCYPLFRGMQKKSKTS